MKKVYEAPQLEVEEYALSASVAGSSCTVRLNMGPGSIDSENHPVCSDFRTWDTAINKNKPTDTEDLRYGLFYDGICDCYVTPARIKALIQS